MNHLSEKEKDLFNRVRSGILPYDDSEVLELFATINSLREESEIWEKQSIVALAEENKTLRLCKQELLEALKPLGEGWICEANEYAKAKQALEKWGEK